MNLLKILVLSLCSWSVMAGLVFQLSGGYASSEDDAESGTYNALKFQFFSGATFLRSQKLAIGWNVMQNNRELKVGESTTSAADLSILEMGPRLLFFLNETRSFVLSMNWNPFVDGDRTTTNGVGQDVDGSSMHFALSFQAKVSRKLFVGGGLNYHVVTITESVEGSTVTEVSQDYTDIYPSIDISWRF